MDILRLVDKLEEVITQGKSIPLSSSVMIKAEKVFEIIDEIRAALPDEIKQAKHIVRERQEMKEEAQKEADKILEEAKEAARMMASDEEVVKRAEQQADEILKVAMAKEKEIRMDAQDAADEMMANIEVSLQKVISHIQRTRDRLQGKMTGRD